MAIEAITVSESDVTCAQDPGWGGTLKARSASVGKMTLGREAAEGRAERPVVPVWGMMAGLGAAASGSSVFSEIMC